MSKLDNIKGMSKLLSGLAEAMGDELPDELQAMKAAVDKSMTVVSKMEQMSKVIDLMTSKLGALRDKTLAGISDDEVEKLRDELHLVLDDCIDHTVICGRALNDMD